MTSRVIIIEKAEHNYGAYCPDLPECVATGNIIEETKKNMQEAIESHVDGMREDGEPIPQPSTTDAWLDISVA